MPIIFKPDNHKPCKEEFIRGQRGKILNWSDCDCLISEDELKNILKPFEKEYNYQWVGVK